MWFLLKLDLFYILVQLIILLELMLCQSTNHSCNNGPPLQLMLKYFLFTMHLCTVIFTARLVHSSPLASFTTRDAVTQPKSLSTHTATTNIASGLPTLYELRQFKKVLQFSTAFQLVLKCLTLFWVTRVPLISLVFVF
jgi:hypothetical protein